jgi:hypothetical protein
MWCRLYGARIASIEEVKSARFIRNTKVKNMTIGTVLMGKGGEVGMNVNAKEKYLLGLLTDIKREIICQDVLRENKMQAGKELMDWYRFTDRTKDKILTVLFILMGDDIPNGGLYTYRDYSVFYGNMEDDENFSRNG